MLGLQCFVESIAEGFPGCLALARNRHRLAGAGRRLLLDEVFEVIIVDIDCVPSLRISWTLREAVVSATYSAAILE